MKFKIAFLSAMLMTGCAHADESFSRAGWTAYMLDAFPFKDDILARGIYVSAASGYVDERKAQIDAIFSKLAAKAEADSDEDRRKAIMAEKKRRTAIIGYMIMRSTNNLMKALDEDMDGTITRNEATRVLDGYAERADLDNDGNLDADERQLAEWSISSGIKIADKHDKRGLRKQFKIIQSSGW